MKSKHIVFALALLLCSCSKERTAEQVFYEYRSELDSMSVCFEGIAQLSYRNSICIIYNKRTHERGISVMPDSSYIPQAQITSFHFDRKGNVVYEHIAVDSGTLNRLLIRARQLDRLLDRLPYTYLEWRSPNNVVLGFEDSEEYLGYIHDDTAMSTNVVSYPLHALKDNFARGLRPSCKNIDGDWYVVYVNEQHAIN